MSRTILLRLIDEAFDHRSWHGTNLRGSIRGLSPAAAAWRPGRSRHNIWELVVHAAYWKYAVRRRLVDEKRGSFPLEGSNWWTRPVKGVPVEQQWRRDVRLLADMHKALRKTVATLPQHVLARRAPRSPFDNLSLITGIAAHDLYHAGQIQVLKRLQAPARSRRPIGTQTMPTRTERTEFKNR
jgi:hypothetical protein